MKEYFVKRQKRTIEPEEILLDPVASSGSEPYGRLEFPVSPFWAKMFLFALLFVLGTMASITVYYQAVKGGVYALHAEENRLRVLFEDAPRGVITDRNGAVLAENQMTFDVLVFSLDLPKGAGELRDLSRTLAKYLRLEEQFVFQELQEIAKRNRAEPTELISGIPREAALSLKALEDAMPGVKVNGRYRRVYPRGPAFAHVLGYTGRVGADELKANSSLRPHDQIGRQGAEAAWDALLRGVRGETRYEVDARLSKLEVAERVPVQPGKRLALSLDADLQEKMYGAMQNHMTYAGLDKGAAVALDPRTGEILALVSFPSFDNNLFAKGISQADFSRLANSRSKPLFNRALAAEYSPGSVIKPFIAAAALEEGVVTPRTTVDDREGRIVVPNPYDAEKPTIFRDWKAHGIIAVREALAQSANVYFYAVGGGYSPLRGFGIARIKRYLEQFGFGAPVSKEPLGEKPGLVPDPVWKETYRKSDPVWRIGDTYLTSIGQGDLVVTPLQLAAGTGVIANGGSLYSPYLLRKVISQDGSEESFVPNVARAGFIDSEWLAVVRAGMRDAVTYGTASLLSDLFPKVAGKTGTAQILANTKTNAFFTAFAPYENPEIVLVIVVEEGQGGMTNAAPVAREILSWWGVHRR